MKAIDKIKLLGIPFDYGQPHNGVREAFSVLLKHGLLSRIASLAEDVQWEEMSLPVKEERVTEGLVKNKKLCSYASQLISDKISTFALNEHFLLNIGGDHGMALGTIHGILNHNPETLVIWADAHGDINSPPSSPTGNFHGMPLAFLTGIASDPSFSWLTKKLIPKNLIFFGPRDLDPEELDTISRFGIQYFSSDEINRMGSKELLEMAIYRADPFGTKPIHLSFDVDLFDKNVIKSTGTTVSNGPRQEEIFLMGGVLAQTGRLQSMDLVEFNPRIGTTDEVSDSVELILSFLVTTLKEMIPAHLLSLNQVSKNKRRNIPTSG